jgi:hypothetical protein
VGSIVDGNTLEHESLATFTIVDEDGALTILELKGFSDPEKPSNIHSWVARLLAKGRDVA